MNKMKIVLILLACLLLPLPLSAQPQIEWVQTFGTPGSDQCYNVQCTPDSGYIMVGCYNPQGTDPDTRDLAIVRVDNDGNLIWEETYGGVYEQCGYAIRLTPWDEDTYMVCGTTGNGTDNDFYLLEISGEDGSVLNSATFDHEGNDWAYDLEFITDTTLVVVGVSEQNTGTTVGRILCLDEDLELIWDHSQAGNDNCGFKGVCVNRVIGTIVASGFREIPGHGNQMFLTGMDFDGDNSWVYSYGPGGNAYDDCFENVTNASDWGYIATGGFMFDDSTSAIEVFKVNINHYYQWSRHYTFPGDAWPYDIINHENGYLVVGYYGFTPDPEEAEMFLYSLDEEGRSKWMMRLGDSHVFDKATTVCEDNEGMIVVAGYTSGYGGEGEDFCLAKIFDPYAGNVPPGPPLLLEPADGFEVEGDILFTWAAAVDPDPEDEVTYTLEISTSEGFELENIVHRHFTDDVEHLYTLGDLPDETTLYWHVIATDLEEQSTASDYRSLLIRYPDPPGAFSLVTPADSTVAGLEPISFTWRRAIDPDTDPETVYTLEFSDTPDFEDGPDIAVDADGDTTVTVWSEEYGVWYWRVHAGDNNTTGTYSTEVYTLILQGSDVDDDLSELPASFALESWPNPFNPSTTITFSIPAAGMVRLAVYDIVGREVTVLLDHAMREGIHSVTFDGSDLPSGIYFCRLDHDSHSLMRKLTLVK